MRTIGAPSIVGLVLLVGLLPPATTMAQPETCGGQPVQMITRGEEPWRELRYGWVAGTTESVTITAGMDIEASLDGTPISSSEVSFAIDLAETVVDVDAAGTARMELLLRDVHLQVDAAAVDGDPVSDEDRAAITKAMDETSRAMVGLTGWEVRDARGDVREFGIDLPEALPEAIRQQLDEGLTNPFCLPSQPVGLGATWVGEASAGSFEDGVRTVTRIEAITGDLVTMTQTMRLDLGEGLREQLEQKLSETEGVKITASESTGEGEGRLVVDLTHVYPVSDVQLDAGATIVFEVGGTSMSMTMDFRTTARVGPEASPAPG